MPNVGRSGLDEQTEEKQIKYEKEPFKEQAPSISVHQSRA